MYMRCPRLIIPGLFGQCRPVGGKFCAAKPSPDLRTRAKPSENGGQMITWLNHPARLVPVAFLAVILFGTALLLLPIATASGQSPPLLTALFVATSAVGVTGLSPVDTATYWTGFGQGVIYLLFHIGGFGIMSAATLLGMVVSRRIGLGRQIMLQAEARGIAAGDVRSVLKFVLLLALMVEALATTALTWRMLAHGEPLAEALWHAAFHAGAAFTNAGFSNYSEGFTLFAGDALAQAAIMISVIIGGLGLPVLHDLRRNKRWSLHTRLTVTGSALLTLLGALGVMAFEWGNPGTLGGMAPWEKAVNALFHSVNTRSCGLNTVNNGAFREETMLMTYALMLTGAGSAGTGGGIKVTTVMILILAVWSEMRGDPDTTAFGRRLSPAVLREALAVTALAVAVLMIATMVLREVTDLALNQLIYEAISAFGNVGLSMGVTASLNEPAQAVIILLMYLGRVGIVTVATGLALRPRRTAYRYPEERPIVG
jgi:trk system potassium uptake protein